MSFENFSDFWAESDENEDDSSDNLLACADDKPAADADKPAADADKPHVSDETIKGYVKAFKNMVDNGAAKQESLDAFKDLMKHLPSLDEKKLQESLKKAMGNEKVEAGLVVQHLKEVLESSGYKKIAGDIKAKEGGLVMKHDGKEIYIQLQYDQKRKDATLQIERKGAR